METNEKYAIDSPDQHGISEEGQGAVLIRQVVQLAARQSDLLSPEFY